MLTATLVVEELEQDLQILFADLGRNVASRPSGLEAGLERHRQRAEILREIRRLQMILATEERSG